MSSTECPPLPSVAPDHTSSRSPNTVFRTAPSTSESPQPESGAPVPSALSIPNSNIPLSGRQMLQLQQDSQNWVNELLKKSLFEGLDLWVETESELQDKLVTLLTIAYETRDLHLAELFTLERQHRHESLALEMKKRRLLEARAKISVDYTELNDVKLILSNRGFDEAVRAIITRRDAPTGYKVPPSDLAYIYHPIDAQSTSKLFRANQLKFDGFPSLAIPV